MQLDIDGRCFRSYLLLMISPMDIASSSFPLAHFSPSSKMRSAFAFEHLSSALFTVHYDARDYADQRAKIPSMGTSFPAGPAGNKKDTD